MPRQRRTSPKRVARVELAKAIDLCVVAGISREDVHKEASLYMDKLMREVLEKGLVLVIKEEARTIHLPPRVEVIDIEGAASE